MITKRLSMLLLIVVALVRLFDLNSFAVNDGTVSKSIINMDTLPPQCGQYAVYFVSRKLGVPISMDEVMRLLPPKQSGETMLEILNAFKKIGFESQGYEIVWSDLAVMNLPVIVHTKDHFIVIEQINKEYMTIVDSDGRRRWITNDELRSAWDGKVISVKKRPDFVLPLFIERPAGKHPHIVFDTLYMDSGDVEREQKFANYKFTVFNRGSSELLIKNIIPDCICTQAESSARRISPGSSGTILVKYDASAVRGAFANAIMLETNDPIYPNVQLRIGGYVSSALDVSPRTLRLGTLRSNEEAEATAYITYHSSLPLILQAQKDNSQGFVASVETVTPDSLLLEGTPVSPEKWRFREGEAQRFVVKVRYRASNNKAGDYEGVLNFKTNLSGQPEIQLKAKVTILDTIEIRPRNIWLSGTEKNMLIDRSFELIDAEGRNIEVISDDANKYGLKTTFRSINKRYFIQVSGIIQMQVGSQINEISLNVRRDKETDIHLLKIPLLVEGDAKSR